MLEYQDEPEMAPIPPNLRNRHQRRLAFGAEPCAMQLRYTRRRQKRLMLRDQRRHRPAWPLRPFPLRSPLPPSR